MDSAIMSLLGAFVLSIIGLFVFMWSLRQGLLVENPVAASVIFAPGEVGQIAHADGTASLDAHQQREQRAVEGDPRCPHHGLVRLRAVEQADEVEQGVMQLADDRGHKCKIHIIRLTGHGLGLISALYT